MKKVLVVLAVVLLIFVSRMAKGQANEPINGKETARIDSVFLLSQTGEIMAEVFWSDINTVHLVRQSPPPEIYPFTGWRFKDDFGWTGKDIVQILGLHPSRGYEFFIERRTLRGGSVVASNKVIATTAKQQRFGTRRNGFIYLPSKGKILGKIFKPTGAELRSVVLWVYVPETAGRFTLSLVSDRFYGMTFFSTLVSPDTLRSARGTDFLIEVPIVLEAFVLPDSFYLKLETDEGNYLYFPQADDGLEAEINYGMGWQIGGKLMVAFGYEGEWVTFVDPGPSPIGVPCGFNLSQNYPNPFNPTTTIRYQLPEAAEVTLTLYNAIGRKIATLVQGRQNAGYHSVVWNATGMVSGIYFYTIKTGKFTATKKMVLVK